MSPDTDIYNIGLPLLSVCNKNIMVQLNHYYSKELKYLHFTAFLQVLQNDPDLSSIPAEKIPQIFQSLFVSTGCDYISFFSEMGNASMYRTFYQDTEFLSSGNFPFLGTLADTEIISDQFESGFLALISAAYFKKHKNGFEHTKPRSHYCTFNKPGLSPLECHTQWLQDVRIKVSERSQFENQMVPNTDALFRHWKRSCWVMDMWRRQADHTEIILQSLTQYGWKLNNKKLTFDWDSEKNMNLVQERVNKLLKGCKCKTGCCNIKCCSCKGKNKPCSTGCECTNCTNTSTDDNSATLTSEDTITYLM